MPSFAPQGPSGSVPPLHRSYYGTPTPQRPRSARCRSTRRFRLSTMTSGSPRFLGNPPVRAPLSDPGRTAASDHSGRALLLDAAMLPSAAVTTSAPATRYFGAQSRGSHARCLRFAVTVTRLLLYDHARLASGWWPSLAGRDSNPLGSFVRFPSCFLATCLPPHPGFAWRNPIWNIDSEEGVPGCLHAAPNVSSGRWS